MNREIKFRIWDKKLNNFWHNIKGINNGGIILTANGGIGLVSVLTTEIEPKAVNIFENDFLEVQFYTSLKDKNGKDIYEGDIVKYRWEEYEHDVSDAIGEVYFEDGIFYFDRVMNWAYNDSNFLENSIEVIGNIFENNDLLK